MGNLKKPSPDIQNFVFVGGGGGGLSESAIINADFGILPITRNNLLYRFR